MDAQSEKRYVFHRLIRAALLGLVLLLALSACQRAPAQEAPLTWTPPALPDTPAGRQFAAYLTAFNASDSTALKQYVADHFTPIGPGGADITARTNSQLRFYTSGHGLNLYQIEESQDTAVTVIAQLRLTAEWRRMRFEVELDPPHRVMGIRIEPTEAPIIEQREEEASAQLGQQIDAYVRDLVAAERFSGVVLVAKDGAPLFEQAYGMANVEEQIPNQIGTRFNLASVSKMFTAVAIAQLAEQGKLAYDDPIGTYLPQYPVEVARRVTIHQLLTHSSGIADYFADMQRFAAVKASRDPQRDYLELFMHAPLRFIPGTQFEYSNSNYIVLGAIIEHVSGESYDAYIRNHIFAPAGMQETTISADGIDRALLARGYTEVGDDGVITPGTRRPNDNRLPASGSAAGGSYATAHDLLRFGHALQSDTLLRSATTQQVLTDQIDYERPGYRYAYGFIIRTAGNERIAGHSGGFEGVDAQFEMYLDSNYTVIVLANQETVADPIMPRIAQLIVHP